MFFAMVGQLCSRDGAEWSGLVAGSSTPGFGFEKPHPEDDPPLEVVRVGLRHRLYRFGVRNGRRRLEAANRKPLPETNGY
jgi:hypothetical protein